MRSKLTGLSLALLSTFGLIHPAHADDVVSARLMSL